MTANLRPVIEDAATRREMIRRKVVEGLEQSFPLKAGKHTLELSNVRVEPKDYSSREQKRAILEGKSLSERIRGDVVREVILATNPTAEGEATALYVAQKLKPLGVRVTRIASGVPIGGELEYADGVTISRALEGRREM